MTHLLVFGAGGQLGTELMEAARARGIAATGMTRHDIDVRDRDAVTSAVSRIGPSLVINCAAYTAVDAAEGNVELAHAVNVAGARHIAEAAAATRVPLIHLSTDYVFDGTKIGAYREHDPVCPIGVYGRTKAEGERAVTDTAPNHSIVRTAWLFGRHGRNFLKTILQRFETDDEIGVVDDQRGCPTSTIDVADALLRLAQAWGEGETPRGVYHVAAREPVTWYEFACAIAEARARLTGRRPKLRAIATADRPTRAQRPRSSILSCERFETEFNWRAEPWRQRVDEAVVALVRENVPP